jgi:hypothetical protein
MDSVGEATSRAKDSSNQSPGSSRTFGHTGSGGLDIYKQLHRAGNESSIDRNSRMSDTQSQFSIFEVNSRVPDDFDQMSMISRGSMARGSQMGETPRTHKRPLVFIDVNLGKEKGKQKLTVFKEDNPREVAEKFALVHGLGI